MSFCLMKLYPCCYLGVCGGAGGAGGFGEHPGHPVGRPQQGHAHHHQLLPGQPDRGRPDGYRVGPFPQVDYGNAFINFSYN